jgi:hypothetical protein
VHRWGLQDAQSGLLDTVWHRAAQRTSKQCNAITSRSNPTNSVDFLQASAREM